MKTTILPIIRHFLTFGAGYLVSKGLVDSGSAEELIGAILSITAVGWSIAEKRSKAGASAPEKAE